jgi:lysophospholipase L1-like esterase
MMRQRAGARHWGLAAAAVLVLMAATACAAGHGRPAAARLADASPAAGTYVALGDSYTSAPLTLNELGSPAGCLRSDRSYPALVAGALHPAGFVDVSCYGAHTADMLAAQHTLTGSNRPQLSALSRRDSLVTIQIGGNDVGFGTVLATCAALSLTDPWGAPCRAHYTSGGTDRLGRAIAALRPRIAALLAEARHRAPRARVLLLGYPDLLPVRGGGCWPEVPLARGDVAYLRGEEMRMNGMLAAQAARAGDTYVNTFAGSVGHDACQPAGAKWVEGLVPSSVALPFHPNAAGERAMSREVLAALHWHAGRPS